MFGAMASLFEKITILPEELGNTASDMIADETMSFYKEYFKRNKRTKRVSEEVIDDVLETVGRSVGNLAFNEIYDVVGSGLGIMARRHPDRKRVVQASKVVDFFDTYLTRGGIDAADEIYSNLIERYKGELSERSLRKIEKYRDKTRFYYNATGLLGFFNIITGALEPQYENNDKMKEWVNRAKNSERILEAPPLALVWLTKALEEAIYDIGNRRGYND
jgi:hypothetical protein